jgi:N-acetylglucosamine-6-sulfatase
MIPRLSLVLSLLVGLIAAQPAFAQTAPRPNIVVIMIDDEDVASLRLMIERGLMPNLKRYLLDKGFEFTNAFSNAIYGAPARASFLTGQYPHNHKEMGTSPVFGGVPKFNEASTIATWLRAGGYRTGLAGRYITGYGVHTPPTSIPPGWESWAGLVEYDGWSIDRYKMNINGTVVDFGALATQFNIELYQTDMLAYLSGEFIRTSPATRPFFLWVTPVAWNREIWPGPSVYNVCPDPSAPFYPIMGGEWWSISLRPPLRYRDTIWGDMTFPLPQSPSFNEEDVSDKPAWLQQLPQMSSYMIDCLQKRYWTRLEVIRAADDLVGHVMSVLETTGKLSNTVVIFTGDNAILDGQHRYPEKSPPYDEGIRIPLVIRTRTSETPLQISQLAMTMDLAPTIAQLAGVEPGHTVDGRSLVPVLLDPSVAWRKMFLFEHGPGYTTTTSIPGPPTYFAVRTDAASPHLFVEYPDVQTGVRGELYDMTSDPHQLQNRYAEEAVQPQVQVWRQWLAAMRTCSGVVCQILEAFFTVPK